MLLSELPQKCCETFPASTIYQHQQAPGFNPRVAVMLPYAVQSSKCRCLGTIALCCQ